MEFIRRLISFTFVFVVFLACITTAADKGSCEWLIEQYFFEPEFKDVKKYIAKDEYDHILKSSTIGEVHATVKDGFIKEMTYRKLFEDDSTAVYSITTVFESGISDIYCHLHNKEGKWKIHAVRQLATTGILFAVIDSLEAMPSIPDSFMYMYDNFKLVTSSDQKIIKYFNDNKPTIDKIVELFKADTMLSSVKFNPFFENDEKKPTDVEEQIKKYLEELRFRSVYRIEEDLEFLIGGMADNILYLLYAPDNQPPRMDPDRYIYVEKMIDGWYLVKTT